MNVNYLHTDTASDDLAWATRAEHWQRDKVRGPRGRPSKRREPEALILSGHGVNLRVEHGALVVQNGFTHYPQKRETWRFFPSDRRVPSRIVLLDADGSVSFDVLAWLSARDIPMIHINWQGEVMTVGGQRAIDPKLYRAQLAAQESKAGLSLATELVRKKIAASLDTLQSLPDTTERRQSMVKLGKSLGMLDKGPQISIEGLRLVEGRAALAYLKGWQSLSIQWKGIGRKPIPDNWYKIGLRQSHLSGTNRHATHPFNAMLNYAYGMLESQVRIAAVTAGLDPTIGYLHATRPGRVALVYDLMEPLRPRVDQQILRFIQCNILSPSDFTLSTAGVCRLHPQLVRAVAGLSLKSEWVQHVVQSTGKVIAASLHA